MTHIQNLFKEELLKRELVHIVKTDTYVCMAVEFLGGKHLKVAWSPVGIISNSQEKALEQLWTMFFDECLKFLFANEVPVEMKFAFEKSVSDIDYTPNPLVNMMYANTNVDGTPKETM